MTQPSKAGAVVLFIFGLPFLGFGLFAAWSFLTSSPAVHGNSNPIAGAIFASVFALIGAALVFGSVYGYQKQKKEVTSRQASPDSPWLWRADWATGKTLSRNRGSLVGWWIGGILASMLVVPIVATALPPLLRNSDPKALILIALFLLPMGVLIGAIRATLRRERYGKTYFEFNSQPFTPGNHVSGQIQLRLNTSASHGIDLRLSCIRRIETGSGKQQQTHEIVLWQTQQNVPQTALTVGPLGTAIPVDFGIPQDAYETNHDQIRDQLLWILHAQADMPGIDYSDNFEIPVFRAGASAGSTSTAGAGFTSGFASAFGSAAAGTAPAFESDASEVSAPRHPKVLVSTMVDGSTQFFFPAFRNPGQTLVLLLVTAGWTGLVYFLAQSKAPWFFAPVFGLFDLLLIYGCFQNVFGTSRIIVGHNKIVSLRKIFGPGKSREIAFGDVQGIVVSVGVQNTTAKRASYALQLRTKGGENIKLAENILDRQEARWIVSQIEKLAGLKTDTHVTLQGAFGGDYGPPPQRGNY